MLSAILRFVLPVGDFSPFLGSATHDAIIALIYFWSYSLGITPLYLIAWHITFSNTSAPAPPRLSSCSISPIGPDVGVALSIASSLSSILYQKSSSFN